MRFLCQLYKNERYITYSSKKRKIVSYWNETLYTAKRDSKETIFIKNHALIFKKIHWYFQIFNFCCILRRVLGAGHTQSKTLSENQSKYEWIHSFKCPKYQKMVKFSWINLRACSYRKIICFLFFFSLQKYFIEVTRFQSLIVSQKTSFNFYRGFPITYLKNYKIFRAVTIGGWGP